jgi:DNA-binding IclR family transcriptional regulator
VSSVGVLDKVMAILDAFADGTDRLEPPEVAARTGISAPTAYRLMGAMAEHRLLGVEGRGYRLGTRLLQLGARVSEGVEVRALALPHMKELRDATGETVELQILTGHSRVPVEMVVGRRTVRTMGQIGVPLPIHLGASSRVLLAWLDEHAALDLARRSAAAHPGTHWDPQSYRERLRLVREQGWEFSAGERDPETSAVSAPILDRHDDVIAAVVVSSTATRLADEAHRSTVIEHTRAAAAAISTELGRGADSPTSQESIA